MFQELISIKGPKQWNLILITHHQIETSDNRYLTQKDDFTDLIKAVLLGKLKEAECSEPVKSRVPSIWFVWKN